MKRYRLILVALGALAVLAAVSGLRRVPAGHEAVRVARSGAVDVVAAGWRWVGPGARLIRYPVGDYDFRVPAGDASPVMFQSGASVPVAFRFGVTVPAGSAESLYRRFSSDFENACRKIVTSAAEIEAAAFDPQGDEAMYDSLVVARVRGEFEALGIAVRSGKLVRWGSRSLEASEEATGAPAAGRRLVIVGVDGGDWVNLRPLMEQGKLPNFSRLARDGATGPLRSEEPMLSPLLWTTMATGRYPEDHGILNFTIVDPESGKRIPISRLYRKVDAFWNMLGDYDRSVAVIGWLATDPAEAVNGLVVTDKFGYLAYVPGGTGSGGDASVYPPSRRNELSRLVVHGDDVPDAEIQRFVSLSSAEIAKHRGEFDPKDPVNDLIHLYASTLTFRNIARHVQERDHPDVLAVYFEWVDAVSHLFMLHAPPRMPDVPAEEYEQYESVVEQAYSLQDEVLGEIMEGMDEHTVLMVISDHGFKSGSTRLHNRPEIWAGNAAKWHRIDGMLGFFGAGVKPGVSIEGASILDVAPTVLALMGLPAAADMPGKPIAGAFEPEVVASFSPEKLATLDRDRPASGAAASDQATAEAMKKLEALGYLTPDNADAHNNLGQRYQQRGEYRKAIEEYNQAISMRPNFYSAYNNLAVCYGHLKMYPEAEAALRKCIALKPDDFYAMNNLAVLYMHSGRVQDGVEYAEKAVEIEPGYVNGRVTLGSAYATMRRYDEAEKQFREALRLEPGNTSAASNLERLQEAKGR